MWKFARKAAKNFYIRDYVSINSQMYANVFPIVPLVKRGIIFSVMQIFQSILETTKSFVSVNWNANFIVNNCNSISMIVRVTVFQSI